MPDASLYEVLEVSPNARASVIKAAYRCLVQQYHPDRNPADAKAAAQITRINQAYAVLADPQKRARYDQKMGFGAKERRGSSTRANTVKAAASEDGTKLRPFAFRPLA
jgi:curved DNA-binding protein CbpA